MFVFRSGSSELEDLGNANEVAAARSKTTKDGVSLRSFRTEPNLRRHWTTEVKTAREKWDGPSLYSAMCSDNSGRRASRLDNMAAWY